MGAIVQGEERQIMSDDQRRTQQPRVRPRPVDPEMAAARRARHAAEGAPTGRTDKSGQARAKKGVPPEVAARRRAEKRYPDDEYYQKKRPANVSRPKKKSRKKSDHWGRTATYSAIAVAAALLVSFLIHTFLFQVILVSGEAMYSTLMDGDWVCITKYDYWTHAPKQGDIVAVNVPGQGIILRRVVGMPGETIAIDGNGDTLINGYPLGEGYVTLKNYDGYPELQLPGGRYFVMSDNRTVKLDSRDPSVHLISRQSIVGKVKAILFPFVRSGTVQ